MERSVAVESLETYFNQFRKNIIGLDARFTSRGGEKELIYADWMAGGRLYRPIEKKMGEEIGAVVSNPHSYASYTGQQITKMYQEARQIIRAHVNANEQDVLVTTGAGMTGALMRLQEAIGIKNKDKEYTREEDRPVVFVTHMEHHSNQVSWQETSAEVVILPPGKDKLIDLKALESTVQQYADRRIKIGAFTACANVNGIITPYARMAEIMHAHGGYCFVDFAASAPYVSIDMHPENEAQRLDAITFSPHKFLGGPGACGILVFNEALHNGTPCVPGGGNVKWTNPWGQFGYTSDVEAMEDGGTPGFMQAMRAALAIRLKEKMGVQNILKREHELLPRAFEALSAMPGVEIVGGTDLNIPRIGVVAFNIEGLHYNLVVRLLNDYFGIQVRGGWSCASTYCHYLFDMDKESSHKLTDGISHSNMTGKPGWVRISLHPTMTDAELDQIMEAIRQITEKGKAWSSDYRYEPSNNEYVLCEDSMEPAAANAAFFDIA